MRLRWLVDVGASRTRTRASRIRLGLFTQAASIILLAACSSSATKTKPTPLAAIANPVNVQRVWKVELGDSEGTFLRPCVLEHAIFAASGKGNLVRVDPSSGQELWRVQVDGGIAAGVGSDGLTVSVVGPRGNILAYDAAGKLLWQAQASSNVIAPPLVGHDLVVVRSTDQRITAYEVASGKRRWVFQKQPPPLSLRVEADLAISADSLLVGFPGGRLGSIALTNGAGRWEAAVSEPKGATEVERLADVVGVPALIDSDVCAASYQGRIGCFETRNGDLRWAREFSARTGVAVSEDAIFGVDSGSHVNGFKRSSGATLWQSGVLAYRDLSPPVVLGKLLAVGDFEGRIHFLSAEDGKIVGRFDAGAGPVISTPQVWNGAALFQTARGQLLLLSATGG
ncbi:MAG TPA: outer membrane protein assembly factor BamB [Burkholderiaceae bacterium]|nr:outer membrane protein assembly factor BamB [Burkholderiaceae bacterium]